VAHWLSALLTIKARQAGERPDRPVLAFRRIHVAEQAQDGFEGSVVDVALGVDVPVLDGGRHAVKHVPSLRLLDGPCRGSVRRDVGQHARRVVTNLYNFMAFTVWEIHFFVKKLSILELNMPF